jgi:nuclear-control-of-ATPase protein 2
LKVQLSPRASELQAIIRALSTTSSSNPLLPSWRISALLGQAGLAEREFRVQEDGSQAVYMSELEWLLVSKATVQTYGLIIDTLLDETIPLSDDIWYWDQVLGSYTYTGLYTIQTSPLRLWDWAKDIYRDTHRRVANLRGPAEDVSARSVGISAANQWRQFYGLVRESIRDRSVMDIQRQVLSPLALSRAAAKRKQKHLRRLREMGASALGVLMDEGLNFDMDDEETIFAKSQGTDSHEWKGVVERSVALMETVLRNITALENGVSEFEDTVFASVEDDPEISSRSVDNASRPAKVSKRLQHILGEHIPTHSSASKGLVSKYGRPPRLVRYWLPAVALLLSSTTILRIVVNRKAEIITWVQEFGSTVRDFWVNWVIEPTKNIIATIRHDKDNELAVTSKESLRGDRESLERMVVDFAIDNPEAADVDSSLTESQIAEIRAKVKEGDITPVLRAFEKGLRGPIKGTISGGLVRSLLIQVQKTKVDVDVALNGIDSLLKSQELVFGFVGLTPGILVCWSTFRYLGDIFGSRRGLKKGERAGQTIRVLRNIDRVLTKSTPSSNGMLTYKDHGLLLCELHVLRRRARKLFPGEIEKEFLEDVNELADISVGLERQLRVVERIRWAYARWLK